MYTGCWGIVQDIFTWYQNMGCNGSEIKLANGLKIWKGIKIWDSTNTDG